MTKTKEKVLPNLDFNSDVVFGNIKSKPKTDDADFETTINEIKDKRGKGRPAMPKPEQTPDYSNPTEEQYLNANDKYLPYSNSIRADLYLKLKRVEHHSGKSARFILEEMMEKILNSSEYKPLTSKKLPPAKVQKLKQLKSAIEMYHERKPE